MSVLEVTFPDEWLALPVRSAAAAARPVAPGVAWADRSGSAAGLRAAGLLRALTELDFDDVASLALPDDHTGAGIQAFCAIGVVPHFTGHTAELRAVAESGRHPGLERDTLVVQFSLGRGIRSSAFRFADELLHDPWAIPFAAEVRFALPLPGRRIGVLHFETSSLCCFEELEALFDTIAGTARVA